MAILDGVKTTCSTTIMAALIATEHADALDVERDKSQSKGQRHAHAFRSPGRLWLPPHIMSMLRIVLASPGELNHLFIGPVSHGRSNGKRAAPYLLPDE